MTDNPSRKAATKERFTASYGFNLYRMIDNTKAYPHIDGGDLRTANLSTSVMTLQMSQFKVTNQMKALDGTV